MNIVVGERAEWFLGEGVRTYLENHSADCSVGHVILSTELYLYGFSISEGEIAEKLQEA